MTTNQIFAPASPGGFSGRYHGFDALRASMMMLGIYLHAVCAYATTGHIWWYQDSQTGVAWDLQCLFIHVFRLPMFFVMCGFFAALLVGKRGLGGFWRNRAMRIALPLVLFGFVLLALLRPMDYLGQELGRNPDAWNDVKEVLPLLGRSKYAAKLRNGFARGGEALAFVENVRIYNDILVKYEQPHRGFTVKF